MPGDPWLIIHFLIHFFAFFFIEGGKAHQMMDKSQGVVVLNSTMGISALRQGKPVYCVDTSIYAMPDLAVNSAEMPLDAFGNHPRGPEAASSGRVSALLVRLCPPQKKNSLFRQISVSLRKLHCFGSCFPVGRMSIQGVGSQQARAHQDTLPSAVMNGNEGYAASPKSDVPTARNGTCCPSRIRFFTTICPADIR
ncbi:hypothetical protein [Desulfovibrio sp. ZJ200]|uniref:capsular polysaccharide export protein, LipB/KpsS family n=1 Tax=Desulfovibrio sp. ZJ200 TaxID=2709792 RepID=UPI001F155026|nr:hypothetical protein [Desulfovibrio sp. ZJ200]